MGDTPVKSGEAVDGPAIYQLIDLDHAEVVVPAPLKLVELNGPRPEHTPLRFVDPADAQPELCSHVRAAEAALIKLGVSSGSGWPDLAQVRCTTCNCVYQLNRAFGRPAYGE